LWVNFGDRMESKGRAGACRVGKLLAGENRDWQKRRENKDEMRAKKKIRENRWGRKGNLARESDYTG
jgi:hypothetical protein